MARPFQFRVTWAMGLKFFLKTRKNLNSLKKQVLFENLLFRKSYFHKHVFFLGTTQCSRLCNFEYRSPKFYTIGAILVLVVFLHPKKTGVRISSGVVLGIFQKQAAEILLFLPKNAFWTAQNRSYLGVEKRQRPQSWTIRQHFWSSIKWTQLHYWPFIKGKSQIHCRI